MNDFRYFIDEFVSSQMPFLIGIATATVPMVALILSDKKPLKEQVRWYILAALCALIGLSVEVMYYAASDYAWYDFVKVPSYVCFLSLVGAFIVFFSIIHYRRRHPNEYKHSDDKPVVFNVFVPKEADSASVETKGGDSVPVENEDGGEESTVKTTEKGGEEPGADSAPVETTENGGIV